MAFKVLAAVLAICAAQNAVHAGPLSFEKTYQNEHKDLVPQPYVAWKCALHLRTAYTVIQEGRDRLKEYFKIRLRIRTLKKNCERVTDENAKLKCLEDVDKFLNKEASELMERLRALWPKVVDVSMKFRGCLFG